MTKASPTSRYGMLAGTLLLTAAALWRAFIAWQHYQRSIAAIDDASIRELEQASAMLEAGFAVLLLAHGVALVILSRRRVTIRWPIAGATALLCAIAVGGALGDMPPLSWPGAYPLTIVIGVAILSHRLAFGWLSLYLGAVVGSALAWQITAPVTDWFAGLFVVGPCAALAFLGAGLGILVTTLRRHQENGASLK